MIWLAVVALGNMGLSFWLVRENRRYAQMAIARHIGEYNSTLKAEAKTRRTPKTKKEEETYASWRNPSEGVAP